MFHRRYWQEKLFREGGATLLFWLSVAQIVITLILVVGYVRLRSSLPIYVIPGAQGGVYRPGMFTDEMVQAFAERVVTLLLSYTPDNIENNTKEALNLFSPELYGRTKDDLLSRVQRVKSQGVTSSYHVLACKVEKKGGFYQVVIRGEVVVYAGGGLAKRTVTTVNMTVVPAPPTENDPFGLQVVSFQETGGNEGE